MQRKSITWQIILQATFPIFTAMVVLATINFIHSKNIQNQANETKKKIIANEIKHIYDLQDITLEILEQTMDNKMKQWSNELVYKYLKNTDVADTINLFRIQQEMGLDTTIHHIYLINREGIITNTTFRPDLRLNVFSFGEEHKNFFLSVFESGMFTSQRFANEARTQRLKKYSYQATTDRKYIVEIGSYSEKLNDVDESMQRSLNEISQLQEGIISVDLFIVSEVIFATNKNTILDPDHKPAILKAFQEKSSETIEEEIDGVKVYYEYSHINRKSNELYKGAVVRIVYDREQINTSLTKELTRSVAVFSIALLAVVLLIFGLTRKLTQPLQHLAQKVIHIANGNFHERAEVVGNNEITVLSEQFNNMVSRLEEYYRTLEEKVKERTEQLEQKNIELRSERDKVNSQHQRIRSSLRYAKTIQSAILPNPKSIDRLFENFVIYFPKDIVSGDLYWLSALPDNTNYTFLAVIDCTGHGVPGAFMSMIADRLLNSIVNEQKIYSPAKILELLDMGVRTALRQHETENDDGMDVSFIRLTKTSEKVNDKNVDRVTAIYAGAKRPIIIYHADRQNIETIKGNIRSIGGQRYGLEESFEERNLNLNTGDILYLSSDGYTDQKSPLPERRRFGNSKLQQILIASAKLTMREQKLILEKELRSHMSTTEQMDDITLLGIRC